MSNSPSVNEQWSIHMVIVNILSKIKMLEAEFNLKPLSQRNDQSIEKLTKWATKHGAIISGVEIHRLDDDEYGMKASKSIAAGDKLVTVPRSLMMTEENMSTSPLCKVPTARTYIVGTHDCDFSYRMFFREITFARYDVA